MQWVSEVRMAFQHMKYPGRSSSVYHGTHCVWCKLLGTDMNNHVRSSAAIPYLHPEPAYLAFNQDASTREGRRRWLVIDAHEPRSKRSPMQELKTYAKHYDYKYNFNRGVELSTGGSNASTEDNVENSLKWLTRERSKTLMLTLLSPADDHQRVFDTLQSATDHLDASVPLWIFLDHGHEHRSVPVGLKYKFSYAPSGRPEMSRTVGGMSFGCTTLVWYLEPSPLRRKPYVEAERTAMQQVLYQILIDTPGHASVADVLDKSRQVLSPLGVQPVLESNHVVNVDSLFFGFPAPQGGGLYCIS